MTPRLTRSFRRRFRASLALATLALSAAALTGTAAAAPGSGEVTLTLKRGAESSLLRKGVKVTYSAKAGKTGATKRAARKGGNGVTQKVSLPVVDVDLLTATVETGGALSFALKGEKATATDLQIKVGSAGIAISGKLGKEQLVLFRAKGAATVDASSIKLDGGKLSLTGAAADALREALGLEQLSDGKLGSADVDAKVDLSPSTPAPTPASPTPSQPKPQGPVDPYLQQCGIAATSSSLDGGLPDPASAPVLSGAKDTVGPTNLIWGFKQSFRSYIVFGAGGSLQALDGASTNGAPPVISSFNFPVSDGEYSANDPVSMSDDQATIEGSGTALFCAKDHSFRVVISNPTVIVDGANSRIVADVDTNLTGLWTPVQRIDLAKLNLSGITPFYNHSGSEVNWGQVPATLTDAGAKAICGSGPSTGCSYVEGTALDPIDIAVKTPYDTGAGDAAAWTALANYVGTQLPFPLPNPSEGGCTLPGTAGGTSSAARTIDEHIALGGTGEVWKPDAARPAALPTLTGTAVTGGNFDWGFRRSLRGSVSGSGDFNLANGATASDLYYGNGGSLVARPSLMSNTAGTQSKYFRWPASSGTYKANGAGNTDDQLVLQSQGRVAFCQVQSAQQYAVIFTNPTIVIDGANSRIVADVAARYRLSWVRGRVDLASLDLNGAGVTVNESTASGTTKVEWKFPDASEAVTPNVGPVSLTGAGEAVVNMLSKTGYVAGLGLDGATIVASFPAGP